MISVVQSSWRYFMNQFLAFGNNVVQVVGDFLLGDHSDNIRRDSPGSNRNHPIINSQLRFLLQVYKKQIIKNKSLKTKYIFLISVSAHYQYSSIGRIQFTQCSQSFYTLERTRKAFQDPSYASQTASKSPPFPGP